MRRSGIISRINKGVPPNLVDQESVDDLALNDKNYQVLRNLIKSKDRQRFNNDMTLLHNALLRWRINSVPLKKHDYQKVHDFRGGLIFLIRGIRRDLLKDILKRIRKRIRKNQ